MQHDPDQEDRLLTVADLTGRWCVSRAHVYNLMNRDLPSVAIGACRRFRLSDVVDYETQPSA